jgi:hypothetical protein
MSNATKYAAIGGLIAATLDIVYAFVFFGFRGVSALTILQSIASGVLGADAYRGGVMAALLGLVLHFVIMLIIAFLFLAAARRFAFLVHRPVIGGALFGVIVYGVMNFVVVPLSASPGEFRFDPVVVPAGVLVHMLFIGVPIALAVRAGLRKP